MPIFKTDTINIKLNNTQLKTTSFYGNYIMVDTEMFYLYIPPNIQTNVRIFSVKRMLAVNHMLLSSASMLSIRCFSRLILQTQSLTNTQLNNQPLQYYYF